MQLTLTTLLATALLSLSGLATASPLLQTRQTTEPPARYYLKTKVDNGKHVDTGTNKTDLWVFSYHTGAGLGAAGLSPNKTDAWEGYLNGTQQLFTYPENEIGPWPLSFSSLNLYERESGDLSSCTRPMNTVLTPGLFFRQMIRLARGRH